MSKYQKWYDMLISKAQSQMRVKCNDIYYEKHHIIPKCMIGSDDELNLVLLTAREHFIAHKLLTKIYPTENSLFYAYYAMANKNPKRFDEESHIKVTSREYERLKIEFRCRARSDIRFRHYGENNWLYGKSLPDYMKKQISDTLVKYHKENPATDEYRQKMSYLTKGKNNGMYGGNQTEDSKKKMSQNRPKTHRPMSEETKKKISESRKGISNNFGPHNTKQIINGDTIYDSIVKAAKELQISEYKVKKQISLGLLSWA